MHPTSFYLYDTHKQVKLICVNRNREGTTSWWVAGGTPAGNRERKPPLVTVEMFYIFLWMG
jgi:hypothetical protein